MAQKQAGYNLLSLYRQLLHLSHRLPDPSKRPAAVALVRDRFREERLNFAQARKSEDTVGGDSNDEVERLGKLVAEAESRLGFLKMMTPRSAQRGRQSGSSHFFYFEGKRYDPGRDEEEEGGKGKTRRLEKARWSNWTGSNLDPDSVSKHRNLLNRAGFRDNSHAKGGLF